MNGVRRDIMESSIRIPGTNWNMKIYQLDESYNGSTIIVEFIRGIHVMHQFILEKEGSLDVIMKQFLERENLSIPDNRLQNFINQQDGNIYQFMNKKPKQKKTTIKTMMNLTEMKDKKIIMMGLSGVGKTSMYKVVFEQTKWWDLKKIAPTEGIQQYEQTINSLKDFKLYILDFAGTPYDFKQYQNDAAQLFPTTSALVFVIDLSNPETMHDAVNKFAWAVSQMALYAPEGKIFCLLHKTDLATRVDDFQGMADFIENSINGAKLALHIIPTTVRNNTIFHAWEQIFKSLIPKSKGLNILAQNLKEKLGLYNLVVLEKRTGFAICGSSSLFDSEVLVGTLNKVWHQLGSLADDLELAGLQKITCLLGNGYLFLEEFAQNLILVLISPKIDILENNSESLQQFQEEIKKAVL
jgi:GTP-binding protein EngB required for normal cell division